MLNDIRLHLDSDEDAQSQTERDLATSINAIQALNIKAFKQYVPSIGKVLGQLPFERLSVFIGKEKQSNIVDFQSGLTLYGPDVDANIQVQVGAWQFNSALLDLGKTPQTNQQTSLQQSSIAFVHKQKRASHLVDCCSQVPIDTLVVLGLGKAQHIRQLFDVNKDFDGLNTELVKHLVIYEPDWEVFRCSLALFDWADFLQYAAQRNLQIYFQIGSNIHHLYDEIIELHEQVNASRMLFYKHTNLPIFMQTISNIESGRWGRAVTELQANENRHQHHHLHIFSSLDAKHWQPVTKEFARFKVNMALFEEYFPDIYASFIDYEPVCWETVAHEHEKTINLYNRDYGNFYHTSKPKQEGALLAKHFSQYPNLDGLVFGYEGDKLRHYMHNTFIRQADMILRENQESLGELPEDVKALMVFGMGSGYMLEALSQAHNIQNLIICEPNPDFFYASLFAIDWTSIFDTANQADNKLYINIGEASSRLFKDLMSQFLVLGPQLLNETFIMQSYHNPMLNQVLSEVRQQLQVIFAMGENFDHVAYGIAHTVAAMQAKTPALRFEPAQYLNHVDKQTPVFIVGNGPSLDDSIDIIKEYKGQAIIVSCGTALQALHKYGIIPDFHGEVEQNRANFDWASRINDRAYLKEISLLSVNGIHPDTCKLYKDVLIAFKSGESSTHSLLAMLPPKSFHCLEHAYPTVTNMAMSFFLSMGFEQLYLIGVDLGFADQTKHHSSASGYYENGKQIYDYQRTHAADMRVRGNRQTFVFTKTEFNISRMIIEQLLLEVKVSNKRRVECFNLSNGVFIEGTMPLDPSSVLVTASTEQKQRTMLSMENCFMSISSDLSKMLASAYQKERLNTQLKTLSLISQKNISDKTDVYQIVDDLSALLMSSKKEGKSLFFYYFFNTINYLCAALNKASLQRDSSIAQHDCSRILQKWRIFLDDARHTLSNQFMLIDNAEAFGDKRERFLLDNEQHSTKTVYYFSQNNKARDLLAAYKSNNPNRDLNQLANEEELISLIDANLSNNSLLIDFYSQDEFDTLMPLIKKVVKTDAQLANIGFVFHCYPSLLLFAEKYGALIDASCLLYCSPLLELQSNSQEIEEGIQDYLLPDEYWHLLAARAQDLALYSQIIIKPRFKNTGLQNAYLFNQNKTDMNKQYSSATMLEEKLSLEKQNLIKQQERCVMNNEYESIAVALINQNIKLQAYNESWYMFKQYLALPKPKHAETGLSLQDSLENRGRKMSRLPFDFELLGAWQ